jgi:hypothetical protein
VTSRDVGCDCTYRKQATYHCFQGVAWFNFATSLHSFSDFKTGGIIDATAPACDVSSGRLGSTLGGVANVCHKDPLDPHRYLTRRIRRKGVKALYSAFFSFFLSPNTCEYRTIFVKESLSRISNLQSAAGDEMRGPRHAIGDRGGVRSSTRFTNVRQVD